MANSIFVQTTHAVAAPCGFARVVIRGTSFISTFTDSRVLGQWRVKICPLLLTWLLAYTTGCTVAGVPDYSQNINKPVKYVNQNPDK